MNRSPAKRIIVAVLALAFGVGGVFAIVQYVRSAEQRALAGQELVEVFVVIEPIEAGTSATEAASAVEARSVPVAYRSEDAVTSIEALGDLATTADLVPGEQLLVSRFAPRQARTVAGGAAAVPDGLLEITIETSPERGVGAQIEPGEYVAVVVTFDAFSEAALDPAAGGVAATGTADGVTGGLVSVGTPQTHFLLRKALVTNIQAQTAAPALPEDEADRVRTPPTGTLLVTLAIEPEQIERLVFAGEFGTIWLARDAVLAPEESTPIVSYNNVFTGDLFAGGTSAARDGQGAVAEDDPEPDAPTPAENLDEPDGADDADAANGEPGEGSDEADPPPESLADTGGAQE